MAGWQFGRVIEQHERFVNALEILFAIDTVRVTAFVDSLPERFIDDCEFVCVAKRAFFQGILLFYRSVGGPARLVFYFVVVALSESIRLAAFFFTCGDFSDLEIK